MVVKVLELRGSGPNSQRLSNASRACLLRAAHLVTCGDTCESGDEVEKSLLQMKKEGEEAFVLKPESFLMILSQLEFNSNFKSLSNRFNYGQQ